MQLVNIGYGNLVAKDRLLSVTTPDSSPIKKLISQAREKNMLIDGTCGRKTCAVLVFDSGHVVLSALQTATIAQRINESVKSE